MVTPADLNFAIATGACSCATVGSPKGSSVAGYEIEAPGANFTPYFAAVLLNRSVSVTGSAYITPNLRVWLCIASSPAYSAFLPASCLPMNSAAFIAPALTSVCAQRYGACFNVASSDVVFANTGIFAAARSVPNTGSDV